MRLRINRQCKHCGSTDLPPKYGRQCKICRKRSRRESYLRNKPLELARNKAWRDAHPETVRNYARTWGLKNKERKRMMGRESKLRRTYGITKADYDRVYTEQEGKCAICAVQLPSLDIDHCHLTNKARGLLCGSCNRALGLFKDNINHILNAAAYLEKQCAF